MKVLVIGGTGHVGTFLCELLVDRGHEVVVASRGTKALPKGVKSIVCDATKPEELIALRSEKFDAVAVFPGCAGVVYDALAGYVKHLVACGSLWMYGNPRRVPTPEITQSECPFSGYAARYKDMIRMLADGRSLFSAVMPPNICGAGKIPLDGLGGRDIEVHKAHRRGETVFLPDGPQALIAPCDAHDIAMLFALCIEQPEKAGGQMFNVGPRYALTSSQFIQTYADIYQTTIPVEYVPWETYKNEISPDIGYWWHFYAHMCPDYSKATALLGYRPQYTAEEAMQNAVRWMYDQKLL